MIAGYLNQRMEEAGMPVPATTLLAPKSKRRHAQRSSSSAATAMSLPRPSATPSPGSRQSMPIVSPNAAAVKLPAKKTGRYALLLGLLDVEAVSPAGIDLN